MTDFKKDTRTAEEQSEEQYPMVIAKYHGPLIAQMVNEKQGLRREGYAACITEQVTPRDEFIAELVEALEEWREAFDGQEDNRHIERLVSNTKALETKARDRGYDHE